MPHVIDKVALIHIKNKRVLSTISRGKDIYYLPGGKREAGEEDLDTLTREIREELSVELVPRSEKFLKRFEAQAHGHPVGVMVQMTCYEADIAGTPMASSEIQHVEWITHADRERSSPVDKLILDWLFDQGLIE